MRLVPLMDEEIVLVCGGLEHRKDGQRRENSDQQHYIRLPHT